MRRQEALRTEDLTDFAPVRSAIANLRRDVKGKHFSDVLDDAGHQYVDLVMEGGGMLGVALVGYVYALEEVGIRFLDLAGTSAGSIAALLLAALDDKDKKKSEKLLRALTQQDLSQFMDGNRAARRFCECLMARRFRFLGSLYTPFVVAALHRYLGLHPGRAFESWVEGILEECGTNTTLKLRERMMAPPGLRHRHGKTLDGPTLDCRLSLIAAEVTTRMKVEFPKDADLFYEEPDEVNPARFVRASMSVPFFFHPMSDPLMKFREQRASQWKKRGVPMPAPRSADKAEPHRFLFIDGGIMSNFPINIFHRDGVPNAPTFGVKLSVRATSTITRLPHVGERLSAEP